MKNYHAFIVEIFLNDFHQYHVLKQSEKIQVNDYQQNKIREGEHIILLQNYISSADRLEGRAQRAISSVGQASRFRYIDMHPD